TGIGKQIEEGKVGFTELEKYMLGKGNPDPNESGRQEMIENIINEYL
ncbi:MAG: xylose isomerase, partial [Planctomycetota bacterium]